MSQLSLFAEASPATVVPANPLFALPMPTAEAVRLYLRSIYKHDRFEGRDKDDYGRHPDGSRVIYSEVVVASVLADLTDGGWSSISRHEAARGRYFCFDREFREIGNPFLSPEANEFEA